MVATAPQAPLGKEPWLAVLLTALFPGLGHGYVGTRGRGMVLGAIALLLHGIGWSWLLRSAPGPLPYGFLALLLLVPFQWGCWFDAYRTARRRNPSAFEATRRGQRDPWLAAFLSTFLPGLGHFYGRRWAWGLLLLCLWLISTLLPRAAVWGVLLGAIAAGHSYRLLQRQLEKPTDPSRSQQAQTPAFQVIALVTLIALLSLVPDQLMEARYIPADSMAPSLLRGDRIIINKVAYNTRQPERGDLIVFAATPEITRYDITEDLLKRIVGLPGETLEVSQGQVKVNGQVLTETYKTTPADYDWGPDQVPPDHYFVLGDARNDSFDSHYWGFLPRQAILGKVTKRFWPLDRAGAIPASPPQQMP